MNKFLSAFVVYLLLAGFSAVAAKKEKKGSHFCVDVKKACEKAGFAKGNAKVGKGLWRDCIEPIMQGKTESKSNLPAIDPEIVKGCKAKHPNYGDGKGKATDNRPVFMRRSAH